MLLPRIVRESGQEIRLGTEVTGIQKTGDGIIVETTKGDFPGRFLINCAGLHADRVARLAGGQIPLRIIPSGASITNCSPRSAPLSGRSSIPSPTRPSRFSASTSPEGSTAPWKRDRTPSWPSCGRDTRNPRPTRGISSTPSPIPDSGVSPASTGKSAWARYTARSARPHSPELCKNSCRRLKKGIWSREGRACAPRRSMPTAGWWTISPSSIRRERFTCATRHRPARRHRS